jgi:uncharacterized phage protein (TIGR01671 family)
MRTVKFRAIDTLGEWVYGIPQTSSTLHLKLDYIAQYYTEQRKYGREQVRIKPETLGEYSGINDKNKKEIYEGDIFKIGAEKDIFEVRFEHGCFMAFRNGKQYGLIGELQVCFIDIIGNIHQNAELLQAIA